MPKRDIESLGMLGLGAGSCLDPLPPNKSLKKSLKSVTLVELTEQQREQFEQRGLDLRIARIDPSRRGAVITAVKLSNYMIN